MQTLAPKRAIVVFGTKWNNEKRAFPEFVYRELDLAVQFFLRGIAEHIIVCGSHAMKDGEQVLPPEEREAFKMRRYILDAYGHLPQFARGPIVLLEDKSTSIPDNWVQLKRRFPSLREIYLVTLKPLLQRVRFFGELVYNQAITITYSALPADQAISPEEHHATALPTGICIMPWPTKGGKPLAATAAPRFYPSSFFSSSTNATGVGSTLFKMAR